MRSRSRFATLTKTDRPSAERRLHGQLDDGLVLAVAPDRQDLDPCRDSAGRVGRERGVRGDEDLRVAGAGRELGCQLQGIAEVAAALA